MTTSALPAADEKARAVEQMFDRIAPRYDLLNRALTFRMDVRWRRATVAALRLEQGARVVDLACGTGDLCRAARAAGLAPVGTDSSRGMLAAARTDAPLVRGDALRLPFPTGRFDGITCGFALRNFTSLPPVFEECARILRAGGRIALLDVAQPANGLARAVHAVWFRRVVPAIGGLVSDRTAYRYLPESTVYLPAVAEIFAMLSDSGLREIEHRTLGFGAAQLFTATRL